MQLLDWCDYGSETNANLLLLHTLSDWMKSKKTADLGPIREAVTQSQSSLAWQVKRYSVEYILRFRLNSLTISQQKLEVFVEITV